MAHLTGTDMLSRAPMAEKRHGRGWKPGGTPGKLHRELGIPEGAKIPAARLAAATRSSNPEIRRDAIRARTMKAWRKPGEAKTKPRTDTERRRAIYDNPRSRRND